MLKDKSVKIRLEASRFFGFTEKSFVDKNWQIRLEAYQFLGFKKKALEDKEPFIRK